MKSFFIDIFRRNIYLLLTASGLFFGGYFLNLYFNSDAAVAGLRNSIQSFLQERERDFAQLTKNTILLTRLADRGYSRKELDQMVEKKYGVFLYGQDTSGNGLFLQFWNDQRSLPTRAILTGRDSSGFVKLSNGQYEYVKKTVMASNGRSLVAIALIPVRWQYFITLTNLTPEFAGQPAAEGGCRSFRTPQNFR